MSCEAIAKVLLLDDDTIRTWYRLYEGDGIEGLTNFSYEGSACQLSGEQQEKLKAWVATALPRTTRQVGAWIENEFGVVYEGRSGLIALLHRLGLEYHKPNVIPRKLDEEKQRAFIEGYEKLLNSLGDDEAVLFADAVHPTHAARPVGCWAPSQEKFAIEQTSGRQRINIHGAIDLGVPRSLQSSMPIHGTLAGHRTTSMARSIRSTQLETRTARFRLEARKKPYMVRVAPGVRLGADTLTVSQAMGELSLLPAVRAAPADALIVADGVSCRHQIADGAGRTARHVAEVLAESVARSVGRP